MQELIFHIAYMERRKYQDEQEKIIGGMNDCIMNDAIVIQNKVIEELTKEYAEYLKKEKEQNNQIIRDVFEHCWNHLNWNGEYDIKDMNEYLKTYNQNK